MGLLDWFRPCERVHAVSDIDVEALKRRNIKALLTDLDNTLVPWQSYEITQATEEWVRSACERGMKCCIVSNTRSWKRLEILAARLELPFVRRGAKPRRGGFREALRLLGVSADEAAVIGDQLFTDILGGNRLGAYTILVTPLQKREFIGTRLSRLVERVILRLLKSRGMLLRESNESGLTGEQSANRDRQMKAGQ